MTRGVVIDLDRPEARVVDKWPGYVCVYGWRRELISERGVVPMSELVGIYNFRWAARRAMRRWLRERSHD